MTTLRNNVSLAVFSMPCCNRMLTWVDERLPTFCPECSTAVLKELTTGKHTMVSDPEASLEWTEGDGQ
jgi:hypothetical protein